LNVGKVVDKMTRKSCIPTDSVKSEYGSSLVHNIGTRAYVYSDKTNLAYLVKVMKCGVGVIRIKRDRGEIWITICIRKIITIIHIT